MNTINQIALSNECKQRMPFLLLELEEIARIAPVRIKKQHYKIELLSLIQDDDYETVAEKIATAPFAYPFKSDFKEVVNVAKGNEKEFAALVDVLYDETIGLEARVSDFTDALKILMDTKGVSYSKIKFLPVISTLLKCKYPERYAYFELCTSQAMTSFLNLKFHSAANRKALGVFIEELEAIAELYGNEIQHILSIVWPEHDARLTDLLATDIMMGCLFTKYSAKSDLIDKYGLKSK